MYLVVCGVGWGVSGGGGWGVGGLIWAGGLFPSLKSDIFLPYSFSYLQILYSPEMYVTICV